MASTFNQNGKTIFTFCLLMLMISIQMAQACSDINEACDITNTHCCSNLVCGDSNICEYPY
ncbi:unnamed protein product [Cunninghamella blakesleeana]